MCQKCEQTKRNKRDCRKKRDCCKRSPTRGVVASATTLANKAGVKMLAKGGSAVDAAIATFLTSVMEIPYYAGLGGCSYFLIHNEKTGKTYSIDGRETAPSAAGPNDFGDSGLNFFGLTRSGISVGVPGTGRALEKAYQIGGKLSLAKILAPAIKLAENGVVVSEIFARLINGTDNVFATPDQLLNYPATRSIYAPGGNTLQEGDIFRNPDYAKTLRLIVKYGFEVLYKSNVAPGVDIPQAIVDAAAQVVQIPTSFDDPTPVNSAPSLMTTDDIANYKAICNEPLSASYRGYDMKFMPPSTSGGVASVQVLNYLKQFDLGNEAQGFGYHSTKSLQVFLEASRQAFADRGKWLGDPDFAYVPTEGLINPTYMDSRAALVSSDSTQPSALPGNPVPYDPQPFPVNCQQPYNLSASRSVSCKKNVTTRSRDVEGETQGEKIANANMRGCTTHLSTMDEDGWTCSWTNTIEQPWGSGITVDGYGFLLNNELTDFNSGPTCDIDTGGTNPGANDMYGGKRPRSSINPALILKDGKVQLALGAGGFALIIGSVIQTITALVDYGIGLDSALTAQKIWCIPINSAPPVVVIENSEFGIFPNRPAASPKIPVASLEGITAQGYVDPYSFNPFGDNGWFLPYYYDTLYNVNAVSLLTAAGRDSATGEYTGGYNRTVDTANGGMCRIQKVRCNKACVECFENFPPVFKLD